MRRALLVFLAASSCSLIFDPARVPASDCPARADRCPSAPNATPSCAASACSFTCLEGFADVDGLPGNGCEEACVGLTGPASLTAISGTDGAAIRWQFPTVEAAAAYRLCTSIAAGAPACVTVPSSDCDGGSCDVATPAPPQSLLFGQVQSLNRCLVASPEASAARAEGFTFTTPALTSWTTEGGCRPATVTTTADTVAVESQACTSTVTVGDERLRDATLEVELRFAGDAATKAMAGVVLTSGQRRLAITTGTARLGGGVEAPTTIRESTMGQLWFPVANSVVGVPADQFAKLRVSVVGSIVSVSVGPSAGPLREVIRWRDRAVPSPWRAGLVTWPDQESRTEFRSFTIRSASSLPVLGPTSSTVRFASDGGTLGEARLNRSFGAEVRVGACPSFQAAPGCRDCSPLIDVGCARVQKVPLLAGAIVFDTPVGLDATRPWRVGLRFAGPADAGSLNGFLLNAASGPITTVRGSWTADAGVESLNQAWPVGVAPDQWHWVEHRFDPPAQRFSVWLDGLELSLPSTQFPPAVGRLDPHLGALSVGGGALNAVDVWVQEATVSQP